MGSFGRGVLGLVAGVMLCSAADAQAVERFNGVLPGGIVATGNTLGLSKQNNANIPGTADSIGTFIASGTALQDGASWPVGTTADWTQNRSAANLQIPSGGQVVYAELVWGGSYQYGTEDVTASLGTPVTLGFGSTATSSVSPSAETPVTLAQTAGDATPVRYYSRSADVTDFVAAHGSGTYTVGGVPATQADAINTLNAAGWTLAVVYRRASSPTRWIGLDATTSFVEEISTSDTLYEGFCTPGAGTTPASLITSAIDGDANRTGDQMLAGPDAGNLAALAGPNNPETNFFASQVNDSSGAVDTTGSFGSANHSPGTNVSGGRQGWDVTTVPLTDDELGPAQDQLLVRSATLSDAYVPTVTGAQIDVDAARVLADGGSLTPATVAPGESATLTIPVRNPSGTATAENAELRLTLPASVALTGFSVNGASGDANGDPVTKEGLADGAAIGNVAVGATKTVALEVQPSSTGSFQMNPEVTYSWHMCADLASQADDIASGDSRTLTAATPADTTPPQTSITGGPPAKTSKTKVKFAFSSSEAGSSFECKLDNAGFKDCSSPARFRVKKGRHTFAVRAIDQAGNDDRSPAQQKFKVTGKKR